MFGISYKLVLLKKGNPYTQVKQLGIDIAENERVWRKKTYKYKESDVSFRKGRKYFIYKDVDSGDTVLRWGKEDAETEPTEPGTKMFKGLIAQAISSISENYGLITLVAVGVGLFAAGAFVMTLVYPMLFPQMMKQTENVARTALQIVK